MKPVFSHRFGKYVSVAAMLLCAAAVMAAPANKAPAAKTPAKKVEPASTEPPQSVFVIPTALGEGKDPFFPNRVVVAVANPQTQRPPVASVKLVLSGMSGTREKPLAIINNRTFETGEEAEILLKEGRTRVRCVEIREDSVLVEVNGARQELRFRKGVNN